MFRVVNKQRNITAQHPSAQSYIFVLCMKHEIPQNIWMNSLLTLEIQKCIGFIFCDPSSLTTWFNLLQAALDPISGHLLLPTVTPRLHPGAVCFVYLAKCV